MLDHYSLAVYSYIVVFCVFLCAQQSEAGIPNSLYYVTYTFEHVLRVIITE